MYIYTCFDVEDLVHADSDDIPRDIADTLSDVGIVGSMCVVGEKARLWERRGRRDVITAVGKHDVGLHTNRHSVHPTVAEYLADKDWDDGIEEALRREGPGAADLARIFGAYPSTWGTGGSSWGPQIPAATRRLGIPSNIYTHVCLEKAGAWWFAGQLCYPEGVGLAGGEDACCNNTAFQTQLPRLLREVEALARTGTDCVLLFGGHPTRFRYTQFWDALNYRRGKNTAPERYISSPRRGDAAYATGLRNLRRMLLAVRDAPGVEMTSVRALNGRFTPESGPVAWADVRQLAQATAASEVILTDSPVASPAQTLDALARMALRLAGGKPAPTHVPSRLVLGPVELPPPLDTTVTVGAEEGLDLFRRLVHHIDATGHLPAHLAVGDTTAGPGPMLRACAEGFLQLDSGRPLASLALMPGPEKPAIAPRLAEERIYRSLPKWSPHDRNLELEKLALHLRLQSWSLKPAVLAVL